MSAAILSDSEWALLEQVSEAYALPSAPQYLDPDAFNRLVRSRIPPRGSRFNHDHPDTCAYIARSKNLNVVAYTANFVTPPAATPPPPPPTDANGAAGVYDHHHHHTAPQKEQQLPPGTVPVPSGVGVDGEFNTANPIHAYFVNLEPSYVAARRKKGVAGDCDDLNMLERRFAYGYTAKVVDGDKHLVEQLPTHLRHTGELHVALTAAGSDAEGQTSMLHGLRDWWQPLQPMMGAFVALPVWTMLLLRLRPVGEAAAGTPEADTVPVMLAVIDKKLSVLERIYVKSIERWLRLPTVEYIEVFGVSLSDGTPTYEKQVNNGQHQPPSDVPTEDMASAMAN